MAVSFAVDRTNLQINVAVFPGEKSQFNLTEEETMDMIDELCKCVVRLQELKQENMTPEERKEQALVNKQRWLETVGNTWTLQKEATQNEKEQTQ